MLVISSCRTIPSFSPAHPIMSSLPGRRDYGRRPDRIITLTRPHLLALIWFLAVVVVITSATNESSKEAKINNIESNRPCAQSTVEHLRAGSRGLSRFARGDASFFAATSARQHVTIPLVFNVLQDDRGVEGHVPYEVLWNQVEHANAAYAGEQSSSGTNTSLSFILQAVHYWNSTRLFKDCETLDFQDTTIRELQVDPTRVVNVFTCKMSKYSGWAWPCFCDERVLPYAAEGSVFVDYRYVPSLDGVWDSALVGGLPQRVGDTLVHELGHGFGLFHPAHGGCSDPNDYVDDTPAQEGMHGTWGECPKTLDTCPGLPGKDAVNNFMDYSDDQCRDTFTPGQADRMHRYIGKYLPSIQSMEYLWKCVGIQYDSTSPQMKSYALCKSACLFRRTPDGKAAPPSGWCYVHGGIVGRQSIKRWGECVCPGSNKYGLIPGVPALHKSQCNQGGRCMAAFWSLAKTCAPAKSMNEASAMCARMGYRLCSSQELSSSTRIANLIHGTPCQNKTKLVWTNTKCGRKGRLAVFADTGRSVCRRAGLAEVLCCFSSR